MPKLEDLSKILSPRRCVVFIYKCGPRVFQRASPLDGRDSLFVVCWKTILKNGLEAPLIFVLF